MLELFWVDSEVSAWSPTYPAEFGVIKGHFMKVVVVRGVMYRVFII